MKIGGTIKKCLAVSLCACLLLGGGLAEVGGFMGDGAGNLTAKAAAAAAICGKCGENVTYTLDSEGTLTISGSGDMEDYDAWDPSPFYDNSDIKNIIIKKGVTSIGDFAFDYCSSLKSITIPNSVTSIGDVAFSGCSSLTSITIPNSVTSIGDFAFEYCHSLTSITIPNSVTSIGTSAFIFCISLKSITIPDSVTSIGMSAFYDTAWYKNQPDGVVYAGKVAYNYKGTMPDNTSIKIKNGTVGIGDFAFYECSSLTSITIPNSVTSIGGSAFSGCSSLKSITIPDSVTNIGDFTFYGCTNLQTVNMPKKLTNFGRCVFTGCKSLKRITIPDGVKVILGDKSGAFESCRNLTSVTIPDSVTFIEQYAFCDCTNLKAVKIPDSVTSIGGNAFGYYYNDRNGSTNKISDFTIHGTKGTAAEKYAKDNGFKFVAVADVGPTSVSLNKTTMSLGKGETTKLTATVAPSNATNKSVTWRTSDSKVLTVDKNGNVKAVGNGTAWITAKTSNGKEKSCKITVKNAPNKVTISKGVVTIGVGEKFTVGSAVPDGSAAAKRTYRTSNSSIVKMTRTDWQGDFVGVKPGTAYVTVRTYNGKESTCKVTVKAAPKSVTISKKALTMKVGQTATLSCSVPSNAGCAARTFRTSNSSVVKMTKTSWTGTFKAMKKGTAYVTVRTYNGKESSCKITVV